MCTAFCTQARQPVLWVAASKVVCMGYYRHRNSQGGPRCGYPALGLCSVQQAGQAHPARWPVQVRLPQGACRRQGQRGPEEGAPAGDLWALDRHGHRPRPRDARGGRATPRHLRPAAHLQVDAGAARRPPSQALAHAHRGACLVGGLCEVGKNRCVREQAAASGAWLLL